MSAAFSKRQFVFGSSVLALATSTANISLSQENADLNINIQEGVIANFHSQTIYDARSTVIDDNALSKESLYAVLAKLVELNIILNRESELIQDMIDAVLGGQSFSSIRQTVIQIYQEISEELKNSAAAIAEVIQSSVDVANEILSSLPLEETVQAILTDVRGALDGAVAGAALGAIIPGLGAVAGALIGAAIGGATDSILGYLDQN